ncbi:prepilin peptidase [Streptomyces sp. NPDC059142]|uniref:prepilin peptidase n=1 Tax=Streptomyces sp. NPDC059142 TaxID=3346739 RepID=UPI0036A5C203
MYATLIVLAVLWGAATGVLLPRAAYRFSVEPDDPWRDRCPAGHLIGGAAGGWIGTARCPGCEAAGIDVTAPSGTRTDTSTDTRTDAGTDAGTSTHTDTSTRTDAGTSADTSTSTDARTAPAPTPDVPAHSGPPDASLVRYAPSRLVPLLGALGCGALAAATGPRPELAVWLLLAPVALLLALVDRNVHRLPDQLTLPLALAAAVLLGLAALVPGGADDGGDGRSWPTALLGGVVLGACYFVLFLINPNGMGFGDVKLALSLGVVLGWYGWAVLFVGACAGFLLGALYGVGLMVLRRAGRKSVIPFGPFMIVGALLGLLLGALSVAP